MGSSVAEEIVDYLVTEGIATTKGTTGGDIFYNQMPDVSANPTIAVIDAGGTPARGVPTPRLKFDVLVRASDCDTARDKQAEIYNQLHDTTEITLTSYRLLASEATAMSINEGEDSARRHLLRSTYEITTAATSEDDSGTGYGHKKDPNIEIS